MHICSSNFFLAKLIITKFKSIKSNEIDWECHSGMVLCYLSDYLEGRATVSQFGNPVFPG